MGFRFQDLDLAAALVAAFVGLILVLAPLVSLIVKSTKDFQFVRPALFTALAEVASLGTFMTVLQYRNSLHHFPPFWILLVGFFIVVIALFVLDATHRRSPQESSRATWLSAAGLGMYVLAASLLAASFTQYSAKQFIFLRVYGAVTDSEGKALEQVKLFWTNGSATLETVTNSSGYYEFLLTKREARVATELRVGKNRRLDKNYIFMPWDENSFPYEGNFKWEP